MTDHPEAQNEQEHTNGTIHIVVNESSLKIDSNLSKEDLMWVLDYARLTIAKED